MSAETLKDILGDKTKLMFFMPFLKKHQLEGNLALVVKRPDPTQIYDTYFVNPPRVKVQGIEDYKKRAQKAYFDMMEDAVEDGAKPSEAHERAASKNPKIAKIFMEARELSKTYLEKKGIPAWKKSPYYRKYVSTQVDGSSLASKLKFPATAAKDLADLKVSLIVGEKSRATSCAKFAIEYLTKQQLKNKNPRHAVKIMKPADLIKQVDKIKIKI